MADKSAAPEVSATGRRFALTGATGFVGRALLSELDPAQITALCRGGTERGQKISPQVTWVPGDLSDAAACEQLVAGAEVVIHLAGLTKALDRDAFFAINADCAGRLAAQAASAGVRHFILMSSLAATRPEVSDYAASKSAGEAQVQAQSGTMAVTVVRAPAVLGPGDDATAPLIDMLHKGFAIAPGGPARDNRFSIIDVQDLARLLAQLANDPPKATALAPYSVHSVGFGDLAATAGTLTGRRVRILWLPRLVVRLAGYLADLRARVRRKPDVFGSGKVREVYSGDWLADVAVSNPTPLISTLRSCFEARSGAKPMAECVQS